MSNLKTLRSRIQAVQATHKITAAMKMIATVKLKKTQANLLQNRHYTLYMHEMLLKVAQKAGVISQAQKFLFLNKKAKNYLIIVIGSNRGLCGGFNTNLVRKTTQTIKKLNTEHKKIKLICIGKRVSDQLKRRYPKDISAALPSFNEPTYQDAQHIIQDVLQRFDNQTFDHCLIIYNQFISALKQDVKQLYLIPYVTKATEPVDKHAKKLKDISTVDMPYIYEPSSEHVLKQLVIKNLSVQLYNILLESITSEQGARMAAMEGASQNADQMIKKLSLDYNRTRQAMITRELIEIISGAQSL